MELLNSLTATELIARLRRHEITVAEICEACLAAIRAVEPQIGAWEFLDEELVRNEAERLDRASEEAAGRLLYGVPVGIKDVFNTKDMPTTMGSPIWEGYTPGNDARVVYALREASAIVFGKTVTAEFAFHSLYNDKTKNPYHPDHIPGTSSSGSAAAVAAEMIPLSLGTQTAGSIMRPASFCGVIGFKPTFGTIPRTGSLKTTDSLDSIGGFARSIDDTRLLFDAIRISGKDHPFVYRTLDAEPDPQRDTYRIGVIEDGIWVLDGFEPYTRAAFQDYVDEAARHERLCVTRLRLPASVNEIHELHATIYDKALSYYFKNEYGEDVGQMSEVMREAVEKGNMIDNKRYLQALERQVEIRYEMEAALQEIDLLMVPTTAGQAPLRGTWEKPDTCLIWTFMGLPTLNLPLFHGPKGLPFGLQVVGGKRYSDYHLLEAAKHLEEFKPSPVI